MKQVFEERTGGQLTMEQVKELVKGSDENDDGKINYEEFVVLMSQ